MTNRRDFLRTLATAAAGFTILPPATTYSRVWRATSPSPSNHGVIGLLFPAPPSPYCLEYLEALERTYLSNQNFGVLISDWVNSKKYAAAAAKGIFTQ